MSPDGSIEVVTPGIDMQIGQLDGSRSLALDRAAAQLDVANIAVTIRSDVIAAMWEKFAFITSTAVLTCLVGHEIGPIAGADGGIDLALGCWPKWSPSQQQKELLSPLRHRPASTPSSPIQHPPSVRRCFGTCVPGGPSKPRFYKTSPTWQPSAKSALRCFMHRWW
jgi:hypothetical protein